MDDISASSLGMRVNPESPHINEGCRTCADFKPQNGANSRCLRDPLNLQGPHRYYAINCGRQPAIGEHSE